jgi:hypothetical protein
MFPQLYSLEDLDRAMLATEPLPLREPPQAFDVPAFIRHWGSLHDAVLEPMCSEDYCWGVRFRTHVVAFPTISRERIRESLYDLVYGVRP